MVRVDCCLTPLATNDPLAYFTYVHPLYPFLNRKKFEEKAFSAEQAEHQMSNSHFSALYHSVLALGCQYHEGGGFGSRNGLAWKLFQISLGLVSEILVPKERLINVQVSEPDLEYLLFR